VCVSFLYHISRPGGGALRYARSPVTHEWNPSFAGRLCRWLRQARRGWLLSDGFSSAWHCRPFGTRPGKGVLPRPGRKPRGIRSIPVGNARHSACVRISRRTRTAFHGAWCPALPDTVPEPFCTGGAGAEGVVYTTVTRTVQGRSTPPQELARFFFCAVFLYMDPRRRHHIEFDVLGIQPGFVFR